MGDTEFFNTLIKVSFKGRLIVEISDRDSGIWVEDFINGSEYRTECMTLMQAYEQSQPRIQLIIDGLEKNPANKKLEQLRKLIILKEMNKEMKRELELGEDEA